MKKIRQRNFFTLLEVLVSMGVFAILMLALMQFFSAAQGVWERSGGQSELFDTARVAAQLLKDDLTTAFYGDEYHEMGDAVGKCIFYKYEEESGDTGKRHLTFAAQRCGDNGLTEVNYVWDPAELTLSIQEKSENDAGAAVGASGWVNFPSNAWIASIRALATDGKLGTPLAENVLLFKVNNFYYNNSATPTDDNMKYRPPALVFITFAVLSPAGYEKLETLFKSAKPAVTESETKSSIRTMFNSMLAAGKIDRFAEVETAIKALDTDPEDFKGVAVPAKQIIFDNVQFYKLMIPIDR